MTRQRFAVTWGTVGALLVPLLGAPHATAAPPAVLWREIQRTGAAIVGVADFDRNGADELLISSPPARSFGALFAGGFYVAGADGSILWSQQVASATHPVVTDDLDGDGAPDVLAQLGADATGAPGELVIFSGRTGARVWGVTSAHAYGSYPATADLDRDGVTDLVNVRPGKTEFDIELVAYRGPQFTQSWTASVPGKLLRADTLRVANVDGDPSLEIVVGTRSEDGAGSLAVVDGTTGDVQWRVDPGAVLSVHAFGPTVVAVVWPTVEGLLGDDNHVSVPTVQAPSGRTHALAFTGATGAPAWTVPIPGNLSLAMSVSGDLDGDGAKELVVPTTGAADDTNVTALNADGTVRWVTRVPRSASDVAIVPRPGSTADIAVGSDSFPRTYAGQDHNEQVVLLSGATGQAMWSTEHVSSTSSAMGGDGVQGVAAADVDGDADMEVVYTTNDQQMVALDAATGSHRRGSTIPLGTWVAAAAGDLDSDGQVDVVGGGQGYVRAVTAGGASLWTTFLDGIVTGVNVQGTNVIVVARAAGKEAVLSKLDARTGAVVWSVETSAMGIHFARDRQHAFGDLDADGIDDVIVGGGQKLPGAADTDLEPSLVAISGRTGAVLWTQQLPPTAQVMSLSMVKGQVVANTYDTAEGETRGHDIRLLDGNGEPVWTIHEPNSFQMSTAFALGDLVAIGLHVGAPTTGYSTVSGRRLSDGSEVWRHQLGGHHLLLAVGSRLVAAGSVPNPSYQVGGTEPADLFNVAIADGNAVRTMTSKTMALPTAAAVVDGNRVLVAGNDGRLRELDGEALAAGNLTVTSVVDVQGASTPGTVQPVRVGRLLTATTASGTAAVGFPGWFGIHSRGGARIYGAWAVQLDS